MKNLFTLPNRNKNIKNLTQAELIQSDVNSAFGSAIVGAGTTAFAMSKGVTPMKAMGIGLLTSVATKAITSFLVVKISDTIIEEMGIADSIYESEKEKEKRLEREFNDFMVDKTEEAKEIIDKALAEESV